MKSGAFSSFSACDGEGRENLYETGSIRYLKMSFRRKALFGSKVEISILGKALKISSLKSF